MATTDTSTPDRQNLTFWGKTYRKLVKIADSECRTLVAQLDIILDEACRKRKLDPADFENPAPDQEGIKRAS